MGILDGIEYNPKPRKEILKRTYDIDKYLLDEDSVESSKDKFIVREWNELARMRYNIGVEPTKSEMPVIRGGKVVSHDS